ncbi:MAG: hypothetical protein AAF850_00710 [Pseudomonadota bacterium]
MNAEKDLRKSKLYIRRGGSGFYAGESAKRTFAFIGVMVVVIMMLGMG